MLSIEETKKACEFAEGYEVIEPYKERSVFMSCHALWLKNSLMHVISEDFYNSDFYKLFLQRVRRGIDKAYWDLKISYRFEVEDMVIYVNDTKAVNPLAKYPDTDEGLEQAIKHIIGKIND